MVGKNHIRIILLAGLAGSGKSIVAEYAAEHGIPHVRFETISETISQIDNLHASGQHTVVVEDIGGFIEFVKLKRHYPRCIVTVALLADRHTRVKRLTSRVIHPITEQEVNDGDSAAIERDNIGGVIALADYFINTSRELEEIVADAGSLLKKLGVID